jgi:hypothetical protein
MTNPSLSVAAGAFGAAGCVSARGGAFAAGCDGELGTAFGTGAKLYECTLIQNGKRIPVICFER